MITGTLSLTSENIFLTAPLSKPASHHSAFRQILLLISDKCSLDNSSTKYPDGLFSANNLSQAKRLLTLLCEMGHQPDFILIDVPYNKKQLIDFVLWMHSNKWSYQIPVIYNKKNLTTQEFEQLKELNITDGIIKFENHF